jgi:hypothetical protein
MASGSRPCPSARRILSMLDHLVPQVIAHGTTLGRDDADGWTTVAAEGAITLAPGAGRLM